MGQVRSMRVGRTPKRKKNRPVRSEEGNSAMRFARQFEKSPKGARYVVGFVDRDARPRSRYPRGQGGE